MKHSITVQQLGVNDWLPYVVKAGSLHGGQQVIVRFPNDYGASIVRHGFSYGIAELAVIKFRNKSNDSWGIVYDTPITDDVIGLESAQEANDILNKIMNLEAK